jgi:predicted porin
VTIDGLFDAGYQSNSYQGVRVSGFEGNGAGTSQFNLRGTEDLGGGLSSSFHLETDFSSVSDSANTGVTVASTGVTSSTGAAPSKFGNGEIAVGLAGGFGQIRFGAVNNAGLEYVAMISPDFGTAMGGGYGSVIGAETTYGVVRWNNSVRYDTPVFNGFQASVISASKQTQGSATTYSATMGAFNVAGATELSARYTAGPLKVLAVSQTTQNTDGVNDTQRDLGVSYALSDALSVQTGVQNTTLADKTGTPNKSAKSIAAVYTMGQNKFAATYTGLSNTYGAINSASANATELGLGYDYLLSKTTKLYVHYAHLNDAQGASAFKASGNLSAADSTNRNYTKSAVGIQVAF